MKRKKKLQNQQIILSQDIHIKFYANFLTFCSLNSFRLKYYYHYLKYANFFRGFNYTLLNSFYINFFLIKLVSSSLSYFSFFSSYESNLLQKFVDSKNSYVDSLSFLKIPRSLAYLNSSFLNKDFIYNYKFYLDVSKEASQSTIAVTYDRALNCIVPVDVQQLKLQKMHYILLKNFLLYISMLKYLDLYKLSILLNVCKIHN